MFWNPTWSGPIVLQFWFQWQQILVWIGRCAYRKATENWEVTHVNGLSSNTSSNAKVNFVLHFVLCTKLCTYLHILEILVQVDKATNPMTLWFDLALLIGLLVPQNLSFQAVVPSMSNYLRKGVWNLGLLSVVSISYIFLCNTYEILTYFLSCICHFLFFKRMF